MQIIDIDQGEQSIEDIIRVMLNIAQPHRLGTKGWDNRDPSNNIEKYAAIMTDEETLFKIYTKINRELFDWRVISRDRSEREQLKGNTLSPSSGATTWFEKEKNFRLYAVMFSMTPIMNYFAELHGIDLVREEFELGEDAKLYLKARGRKPNGLGGSKS